MRFIPKSELIITRVGRRERELRITENLTLENKSGLKWI